MLLAGGALLGAAALAGADTHPPGATARCKDKTWAFTADPNAACSRNGGVAYFVCPGPLCAGS